MSTQQTSLLALLDEQPMLHGVKGEVYELLSSRGPMNNHELSQALHIGINCITNPIWMLRKLGLVEEDSRRNDKTTGHLTIYWRAVTRQVEL